MDRRRFLNYGCAMPLLGIGLMPRAARAVIPFGVTLNPSGGDDSPMINSAVSSLPQPGGGTVFLARGTYLLMSPIYLPSNVHLVGESAQSTSLQAAPGFSGSCLVSLGNSSSSDKNVNNVFDTRISSLVLNQAGQTISSAIVYSNCMNQLCAVEDVQIWNVAGCDGIAFEMGLTVDGPSLVEINNVMMFTHDAPARYGIRSSVGGMILKVAHCTIEGTTANPFTIGIVLDNDMIDGDALHFEGCAAGLVFGTSSWGGNVNVITGSNSVPAVIGIVSNFQKGSVTLQGVYNTTQNGPQLLVENNRNNIYVYGNYLSTYSFAYPTAPSG